MQALVAFTIVLACKSFTAYSAHERPFVCMCAKMRAKIVSAREPFWAKIALEGCRMLLHALGIAILRAARRSLVLGISEAENILTLIG
jgi:hypothetical protein